MGAGSSTEQRSPEQQPAGSDTPSEPELSGHGPAAEAPGAAGEPADADPATKVCCGHLPGWGGMERCGVLAGSACHNFPPVQPVCKLERSPLQALGVFRTGAGLASLSWVPKGGDLALPQPSNLALPAALQPFLLSSGGLAA